MKNMYKHKNSSENYAEFRPPWRYISLDEAAEQEGAWEQVALYDTEELAANMWYQVTKAGGVQLCLTHKSRLVHNSVPLCGTAASETEIPRWIEGESPEARRRHK